MGGKIAVIPPRVPFLKLPYFDTVLGQFQARNYRALAVPGPEEMRRFILVLAA
jgi:hypothetical protein